MKYELNQTQKNVAKVIWQKFRTHGIGRRQSKELSAERRGAFEMAQHVAIGLSFDVVEEEREAFKDTFYKACGML